MANLSISNWSNTSTYALPDGLVQGPDGTANAVLPINLVSQNAPDYTIPINTNYLYMLENFASGTAPNVGSAPKGMLWYDTSNPSLQVLKIQGATPPAQTWLPLQGVAAAPANGVVAGAVQFNNGANSLAADSRLTFYTSTGNLVTSNLAVGNTALFIAGLTSNANILSNASVNATGNILANYINANLDILSNNISSNANISVGNVLSVTGNFFANGSNVILNSVISGSGITGAANSFQYRASNGVLSGSNSLTWNSTTGVFALTGNLNISANANVGANLAVTGNITGSNVIGNIISTGTAPASNSSTGVSGALASDGTNFYVATATNTWRNIPLQDFGTGNYNITGNIIATINVRGNALIGNLITTTSAPANAATFGTPGQIAYASGFLYVCVANNTWQRVAIATW